MWVRILLQSLKLQITCLFRAKISLTFRQLERKFTLKRERDILQSNAIKYHSWILIIKRASNVHARFLCMFKELLRARYVKEHKRRPKFPTPEIPKDLSQDMNSLIFRMNMSFRNNLIVHLIFNLHQIQRGER